MSVGGSLPVRILFQGRPLEGVLDLAAGRTWLVKAVHMLPAPAGSGADWESLWASLTFEIPETPGQR